MCSFTLSAVCPSGRGEVVGAAGRPQGPHLASRGAGMLLSLSKDTGGSCVCLSPAFGNSNLKRFPALLRPPGSSLTCLFPVSTPGNRDIQETSGK